MKDVFKVYVSGSREELEPEREIVARNVSSLFMEPVTVGGILPIDTPATQQKLTEEIKGTDVVVLLLWKSLSTQVEQEYEAAISVRVPLIVCVKMLTGGEKREPELERFLGRLRSQAENASGPSVPVKEYWDFRSLASLEKVLQAALTAEVRSQLKHKVITAATRAEMYRLGARITASARNRLFVVQKTAILLLGARPYEAPKNQKYWFENEYLNCLKAWIEACVEDPTRHFVYLYDVEETRKEIEDHALHDNALENLLEYKNVEKETGRRFRLSPMSSRHPPGPMTVGDDWFAFWVMGAQDAVTISFSHNSVCEEVVKILGPLASRDLDLKSQANELGLNLDNAAP